MDINKKLICGIDLGSGSCSTSLINLESKEISAPEIDIFSTDVPSEMTTIRQIRRQYIRKSQRRSRLMTVLNMAGCLPESFSSMFNFETRDGDHGIGTLKKEFKKDEYPDLLMHSSMSTIISSRVREINMLIKNGNAASADIVPIYLAHIALEQEISDSELAIVLLHLSKKRGTTYLDEVNSASDDNKKKKSEFLQRFWII